MRRIRQPWLWTGGLIAIAPLAAVLGDLDTTLQVLWFVTFLVACVWWAVWLVKRREQVSKTSSAGAHTHG